MRHPCLQVPGGALIFLQNTGMILEPPSARQISYARLGEAERLHLLEGEEKVLEERTKRKLAKTADAAVGDTDLSAPSAALGEVGQKGKETTRLKRKRAKVRFQSQL